MPDPRVPDEPLFRVLRGSPDDTELAALSVVLLARIEAAAAAALPAPRRPSRSGSGAPPVAWHPVPAYRSPGAWTSY